VPISFFQKHAVIIFYLNAQGKPNSRGGLSCFWCPNKTSTHPLGAIDTLTIIKNGLEMSKLPPPKEESSRTLKNKPSNATKADSQTLKKILVYCYVAIRVQR
jgi:hypothetical protein